MTRRGGMLVYADEKRERTGCPLVPVIIRVEKDSPPLFSVLESTEGSAESSSGRLVWIKAVC
jgi:hypothetical protein